MSPTSRTQLRLRIEGYIVANVERWNPFAKRRQDLFGCIDTLAMHNDYPKVLAIQSTSGDNHAKRVAKVRERMCVLPMLGKLFDVQVWSWRKGKAKRGGKKIAYKLRVEKIH
jgi:hypothetical protein